MDENLRDLQRQAVSDPKAAIAYYHYLKRKGILLEPKHEIPVQTINIVARGLRGSLDLHPISGTEIVINSHYVNQEAEYFLINRTYYHIRGRYYFYPELGWVPYDPEIIKHAQEHVERNLQWHEQRRIRDYDDRGIPSPSSPEELTRPQYTTQYWLPRSSLESGNCFSCGETSPQQVHLILRNEASQRGSPAAYSRIDDYLRVGLSQWAKEHQEIMKLAQLNSIQNEKKYLDEKLTELYDRMAELQAEMAKVISEEIQLGD